MINTAGPFYRLGKFIYRKRLLFLLLWFVMLLGAAPFLPHLLTPFKTTGFVDETSNSVKADHFLDKKLGYGTNRVIISFTDPNLSTNNPLFLKKMKQGLSKLKHYPLKLEIIYPGENNKKQYSKDKHSALAIVLFKSTEPLNEEQIKLFKDMIKKPHGMTVRLGGDPIFMSDINQQTKKDLYRADMIAGPFSILVMLLVFGTVISALIPIILAAACALTILAALFLLGHVLTLSVFTLNIALLLGLCLCLDYCLFILYRFKNELQTAKDLVDPKSKRLPRDVIENIIGTTLETAGKAVFFSGLAVFVSLAALLIFPITILFSVGVGGLAAVFFAVLTAIFFLPAILSIVQTRVNKLGLPKFLRRDPNGQHIWRVIAQKVVKRPAFFFIISMIFLLALGSPFLKAKFGLSDVYILPAHTESRQFMDNYKAKFDEHELKPLVLVVTSQANILSQTTLNTLYDFAKKIKDLHGVSEVNSIVTINDKLSKHAYYQLYKHAKKQGHDTIDQLLRTTTREHFTKITVVSKYAADSTENKNLISRLENMKPGKGLNVQVTGIPVNTLEVLSRLQMLFPYALIWIIVLTYCILLLLLRSLFLPFKAILMNIISLSASYGVLVFVFQEGHWHEFLNFSPQGMLDTSLLIIIFCALFGFSMDYEVFLLTRIKEFYEKTKDHKESIILGIDHSSRIITSAAIIVIVLCGSFMVAEVLMVKEFGLGIAIAIFVDAFLVRSILVPATMVLLKQWNWYLPKWLDKLLPKI